MVHKTIYCLICFVFAFKSRFSNGADILALMPYPSYSHQIVFTELWKELSLKGHQVTVVTSDPLNDPMLTNLTEISVNWAYKFVTQSNQSISKLAENEMTMWNAWEMLSGIAGNILDAELSEEPFQDLIHNKAHHFDVLIVAFIYPELLAFSDIFNCPTVLAGSFEGFSFLHNEKGNPSHPVLYPEFLTNFANDLSFKERMTSFLFYLKTQYFVRYVYYPNKQKLLDKHFAGSRPVQELASNADLLFVNAKAVINGPRAIGPTTINIASPRKPMHQKPLPADIQIFLDEAEEGFVYFSLGSNVKSNELHPDSLQAIIDALKEIPHRVLWKFEAEDLPGRPDNVRIVKWAPQHFVLGHQNIRLFISQGGLQSSEEAIYNAVPMVLIPFFSDQSRNSKIFASKGIAKIVDRYPFIDRNELKSAIVEVINERRYKEAATKLKHLALDEPMTGLERAIWWIEYAIRNNGTKHLRNPAADLPLYQFYLLDVISFLLIATSISIYLVVFLVKNIIGYLRSNFGNKIEAATESKKLS